MRGKPLMPCSPAKARHMLKAGKAFVVRRTPFTIKLTIATGETKQDVTHCIDAYCIAGNLNAHRRGVYLYQRQVRKHNRQIHKCKVLSKRLEDGTKIGYRKLNQSPYLVHGFRLFDKVRCFGQTAFIFGRRSSGSFDVRRLDRTRLSDCVNFRKLKLLEKRRTYLTELRKEDGASSLV